MKVLQIVYSDYAGGMEKHVAELSNSLAEMGLEVSLISGSGFAANLDPKISLTEISLSRSRFNPLSWLRLRSIIRSIDPDIIHCHGSKAAKIALAATVLLSVIKIVTIHGLKRNLKFTKHFDTVICVSQYIQNLALRSNKNAKVVYNGINVQVKTTAQHLSLLRKELKLEPHDRVMLAIGRLAKVKGFDQLIKSIPSNIDRLLIAGDGTEKQLLQTIIERNNLKNRVQLLGWRTDVPDLICLASVVVISSHREGFSYACLEALMLETPVLSTNVPVANELLAENFIYQDSNENSFKSFLEINCEQNLKDMQEPVFSFCRETLTIKHMAQKTVAIYERALLHG